MTKLGMKEQRLYYIDNLKMMAISCVVIGHVCSYTRLNCLIEIIYSFHMAVFFAASSYIASLSIKPISVCRKIQQLMIPFVSICLLAIARHGFSWNSIEGYLLSETKWGYWFLLTLLMLFLVLKYSFLRKTRSIKQLLFIAFAIEMIFVLFKSLLPCFFIDFFCIRHITTNWPIFVLGYLFLRLRLQGNMYMFFGFFIWIGVLALSLVYGVSNESLRMIGRFSSVIFFFNAFQKCMNFYIPCITPIGKASLTIYLFHYFLLSFISYLLFTNISPIIQTFIGSIIIIFICTVFHYQVIMRFRVLQLLFCGNINLLKKNN